MASRDLKNSQFAGGDITLTEVSERLARRGWSVTYVCSGFKGGKRVEQANGVTVLRLGNLWTTALAALVFYARNRSKFDVILQESLGALRIPYFAPLYVRKPFVAVWYQRNRKIFRLQFGWLVAIGLSMMERLLALAHRSKLILCPSRQTMLDIQQLGLDYGCMRVYTPGLADGLLKQSFLGGSVNREDMILWIGKIRKYKCTHHAILALDRLRKSVPGTRLSIVGFPEDADYLHYMKDLTGRLGLSESVEFRFGISEAEKGELLRRSKALLVTSPIEGFANVVSEANAFGAPVVVTDGVPAEVVQDGTNGIRVAFGDFEAMAEGCRILLTDDAKFENMSLSAVSSTRSRTWEQTTNAFKKSLVEAIRAKLS